MSALNTTLSTLGLDSACADETATAGFSLFKQTQNFPSLDWINTACPALPRVRDIHKSIDAGYKTFSRDFGETIEAIFYPFLKFLVWTEQIMLACPWWLMIAILTGATYAVSRRKGITLGVAGALSVIGFFGMWDSAMQTLSFIFVCALICMLLGIPTGILMARYDRFRAVMVPILDVLQTMPSFVYLIPVVMLFGIGKVPGAIAVIAYAIPPVIRLTDLGIRLVDKEVLEAADAFGATAMQKLVRVQLPLAMPNILAGINQTIMMSLAMVVIASMVSVRGLGIEVLEAVTNQYLAKGLFNGLAVVALAIIFDRVTRASVNTNQKKA
jgi:glycine betaine/proline transport system permease protein